ncbi:MAG: acyl carrier protein [Rhodothalassiaceae bacterium]
MSTFEIVRSILTETLGLGDRGARLTPESGLLGEIPEFDSMAVVGIVAALEERFDILFEDDEINGEVFATVGSLSAAVEAKRAT